MRYRQLGGTGVVVSELCLGTMTFGNGEVRFKPLAGVDQAGADALVERSLAAGINFFDTAADSYSSGESELDVPFSASTTYLWTCLKLK